MVNHLKEYREWYIFSGVAIIVIAIVYWYSKSIDKTSDTETLPEAANDTVADNRFVWLAMNDNFPLKLGSYGDKVKTLQNWLMNVGKQYLTNGADGKFGPETETALINFKNRNNVSEEYWNKLNLSKIA